MSVEKISDKELLKRFEVKAVAIVLVLLGSVGFAFDFLLRAKEYPQLALLMLGMIGLVVGFVCLVAALYMAFILKISLDESNEDAGVNARFAKLKRGIWRSFVIAVGICFLVAGYLTWDVAFQNFGEHLKALRVHIESQILD